MMQWLLYNRQIFCDDNKFYTKAYITSALFIQDIFSTLFEMSHLAALKNCQVCSVY